MGHVFISHAKEDSGVAENLAALLKESDYAFWLYTRNNVLGDNYLLKIASALRAADAVILIVSPYAFDSYYVDKEVMCAEQHKKKIIPLLHGVTHEMLNEEKPLWSFVIGTTVSLPIPDGDVSRVMPDVISCLAGLSGGVVQTGDGAPRADLRRSRVRRGKLSRRAKVAAALCSLATLALLLWNYAPPALHLSFSKQAKPFEMTYDGNEDFFYVVHVEVKNYGPKDEEFADVRAEVKTPAAPGSPQYVIEDANVSVACYDDDKGGIGVAPQLRKYVVGRLGGTIKLGCRVNVKLPPEDGPILKKQKKEALLRASSVKQLTVMFKGSDEDTIGSLRFCFDPSGLTSFSTWNTETC